MITAKAYANAHIATRLQEIGIQSPIVILQNGIGVEKPFISAGLGEIYRCILYATSQTVGAYQVQFRQVASSPIGVIHGNGDLLTACVAQLDTTDFSFHVSSQIQEAIWKKAIINAVFNTICPLLEVDNGIFARDAKIAGIAQEVVAESVQVAQSLGLNLEEQAIMNQLLKISHGATGQLISTLQDINHGRRTEIESLNLEIARVADLATPSIPVTKTRLLGELVLSKSKLKMEAI